MKLFNTQILILNDFLYISKNKDVISIIFSKHYNMYDYLDEIQNYIMNNLSSSKIKYKNIKLYQKYENRAAINFDLSYYDEMIFFFNNLSVDDEVFDNIKIKIATNIYNL